MTVARFEEKFVKPRDGRVLIVGSKLYSQREDRRKRYDDAIGLDMEPGDGVDVVLDLEEEPPSWLGQFSHVECLSTIEHCNRPWLMARQIEELLLPGGTIYVSIPLVWRLHSYPQDNYRVTPNGLRHLFERIEWDAICVASDYALWPEDLKKIPCLVEKRESYLLRTETLGFGRKRA